MCALQRWSWITPRNLEILLEKLLSVQVCLVGAEDKLRGAGEVLDATSLEGLVVLQSWRMMF